MHYFSYVHTIILLIVFNNDFIIKIMIIVYYIYINTVLTSAVKNMQYKSNAISLNFIFLIFPLLYLAVKKKLS